MCIGVYTSYRYVDACANVIVVLWTLTHFFVLTCTDGDRRERRLHRGERPPALFRFLGSGKQAHQKPLRTWPLAPGPGLAPQAPMPFYIQPLIS